MSEFRSHWLRDALAREGNPEPLPALSPGIDTEVVIAGGGFIGLWTALHLKRQSPNTDVVLIEKDTRGSGASGRNSGFIMNWWSKYYSFAKWFGPKAVLCKLSASAVSSIADFCKENDIDAEIRNGWLWVAGNSSQGGAWDMALSSIASAGVHPFPTYGRKDIVDAFASGVFDPRICTVQPALLARNKAIEAGVRVFEKSPMVALERGSRLEVSSARGNVRADKLVVALNAWTSNLFDELNRSMVVVSSDISITSPIPHLIRKEGWQHGVAVSDGRRLANAWRPTADGRLTAAKAGGPLMEPASAGQCDHPSSRTDEMISCLHRYWPKLSQVKANAAWKGPIEYSSNGSPFFGSLVGTFLLHCGTLVTAWGRVTWEGVRWLPWRWAQSPTKSVTSSLSPSRCRPACHRNHSANSVAPWSARRPKSKKAGRMSEGAVERLLPESRG